MSKFSLGKLTMTRGVYEKCSKDGEFDKFVMQDALARYIRGDWGDSCEEDAQQNDESVRDGERILAVYKYKDGTTIWIITEWDRSVTTILFPEEY